MIDKLELTHLRTLDALNRFDTISAAAEHLDVSQQAVSLQLKKLRAILGDPLFVRTGQGMAPTPYAKLIAPHIGQVLAQLSGIPLPFEVRPEQAERTLVISGTDYTQKVIVADLVRTLRAEAPKVKVAVVDIEVSALTRKLHQGEIDLIFTVDGYVAPGLVTQGLRHRQPRAGRGRRHAARKAGGARLHRHQSGHGQFHGIGRRLVRAPGIAAARGRVGAVLLHGAGIPEGIGPGRVHAIAPAALRGSIRDRAAQVPARLPGRGRPPSECAKRCFHHLGAGAGRIRPCIRYKPRLIAAAGAHA
jgi:DNA-binding transcriptional LysR family regulator